MARGLDRWISGRTSRVSVGQLLPILWRRSWSQRRKRIPVHLASGSLRLLPMLKVRA